MCSAICNGGSPLRTAWSTSSVAALGGAGLVKFSCPPDGCADTFVTFRGTSSTDPDDDIVSWSIAFADGTSASGSWTTDPPSGVTISRPVGCVPECDPPAATLTVTDSAGESSSHTLIVDFELPD